VYETLISRNPLVLTVALSRLAHKEVVARR
jgi:hypothetical protein